MRVREMVAVIAWLLAAALLVWGTIDDDRTAIPWGLYVTGLAAVASMRAFAERSRIREQRAYELGLLGRHQVLFDEAGGEDTVRYLPR